MEPPYLAQLTIRPASDVDDLTVLDGDHRVVAQTSWRPAGNVVGTADWDRHLATLGWRRTGTWQPDALGFRCAVERR